MKPERTEGSRGAAGAQEMWHGEQRDDESAMGNTKIAKVREDGGVIDPGLFTRGNGGDHLAAPVML